MGSAQPGLFFMTSPVSMVPVAGFSCEVASPRAAKDDRPPHLRRLGRSASLAGQRHHARQHSYLRPVAPAISTDDAPSLGRGGRTSGGTHGQLGSGSPEPGSGPDRSAGPDEDRSGAYRRVLLPEPGAPRGNGGGQASGRGVASAGPPLRRRRPLARTPPLRSARDDREVPGLARHR